MSDYLYIIMCGGNYHTDEPKHLKLIDGEPILERTVRLLRENGIQEIAITATDARFNKIIERLQLGQIVHHNTYGDGGRWLEGFVKTPSPTCYIFGDVVFSPEAIKTIVETETDTIEFFASAPPFDQRYFKNWAEPFAFKVKDYMTFTKAVRTTMALADQGAFYRDPISWELWQVIKKTPLKQINYTNYVAINDYTCDVDCDEDLERLNHIIHLERQHE